MQTVGSVVKKAVQSRNPQSPLKMTPTTESSSSSAPRLVQPKPVEGYACFVCRDVGWVYHDVPVSHSEFGKAFRCNCQYNADVERRRQYLLRIDGLTPDERKLRFDILQVRDNGAAIEKVQLATSRRRGSVTLTGRPGLGKSALLICAVNEAREANVPAVYTTITDLLDYLKQAYNPQNGGLTFDSRWDLLIRAEVLALDELDEFNTTPWAMERFLRLIDERWRRMDQGLTLLATNSRINALPDKVASRLRDGRGEVIEMQGADMRPYQVWS